MSTRNIAVLEAGVSEQNYVTKLDRMLIGGELVAAEDGNYDYSISPVDERIIGRTPAATARDVDRAVMAAEAAWPAWAALSPLERGRAMRA